MATRLAAALRAHRISQVKEKLLVGEKYVDQNYVFATPIGGHVENTVNFNGIFYVPSDTLSLLSPEYAIHTGLNTAIIISQKVVIHCPIDTTSPPIYQTAHFNTYFQGNNVIYFEFNP